LDAEHGITTTFVPFNQVKEFSEFSNTTDTQSLLINSSNILKRLALDEELKKES